MAQWSEHTEAPNLGLYVPFPGQGTQAHPGQGEVSLGHLGVCPEKLGAARERQEPSNSNEQPRALGCRLTQDLSSLLP